MVFLVLLEIELGGIIYNDYTDLQNLAFSMGISHLFFEVYKRDLFCASSVAQFQRTRFFNVSANQKLHNGTSINAPHQNINPFGQEVSEEKIFLCISQSETRISHVVCPIGTK